MLMEATGFRGDVAVIDAVLVVVEAWAAQMAEGLSIAPNAVREAHLHLLVQQAELLLDSGGRIAQAVALAEHVTFLAGVTEGMSSRIDGIADSLQAPPWMVASRETIDAYQQASNEIHESESVLTGPDRDVLADWEAELVRGELTGVQLAGKLPITETVKATRRKPAPLIEETDDGPMLVCTGCGRSKPATREFFFRNSKSSTGFESRCRACRSTIRRAA